MNKISDNNNPGLNKGDRIHDYLVKQIVQLKKLDSCFYRLEHLSTGAQHIHISNRDKENTFSVAFKTVPSDSTGVAHILEHTALCGSKNFPVHDPFFSMLKRSLSTFMNAFTASDWTMYPFSTQNKTDFYNLMDVYLDAAFFPNLEELSFKQEGHRFELKEDKKNGHAKKLVYQGVVYNEMKGAMSSPQDVMHRSILNALYPSTTYRNNSGGDPSVIPQLTHDQLKAFHRRHYHPSNAFFYTYGNLPLKKHLKYINGQILCHFQRTDPETDVPSQKRWNHPKEAVYKYAIDPNEDILKKCQICTAWLTADIKNTFEVLVLTLLGSVLLGNPASPLRKALIDSKLGSSLCDGTGFDADNRDTLFVCGLKDVEASSTGKIETIIFDVLTDLVKNGIDPQLIESAIHQLEFHRKEVTNTPYPYGIKLLLALTGTWFHGGDPVKILQFDDDLEKLRNELAKGAFFEERINKYFLENQHRVRLSLIPDPLMEKKEEERVNAELSYFLESLSEKDLEKIKQDSITLKRIQETKEDVSCLPTLDIDQVPPLINTVKETKSYDDFPGFYYKQPTSGIFYFSAVAGTGLLQKQNILLVPFFCYAFSKIGTKTRDYTDMARRIEAYTGGVHSSCSARTRFDDSGSCLPFISINGKCLVRNQTKMMEIIEELFCDIDFSDLARLKSLLLEYRAGMESMIIQNGHRLAMSLASRNFSRTQALSETWHGVHQLQTIRNMTHNLTENSLASIAEKLSDIGKNLLTRHNVKIAFVGEDAAIESAASSTRNILNRIGNISKTNKTAHGFMPPEIDMDDHIPKEGWSTSSSVSFVARTFKTVRLEHKDAPVLAVISKLLRSLYLHREIREKGGAYGGFAVYNSENGLFCFASYRDPHIVSTLNVYDNAMFFIKSGQYSDEDIKEAILQVCSEIDKPDPPGSAARKAFLRNIVSLLDEKRQQFKKRLLAVSRSQVIDVAQKYFDGKKQDHAIAVISGEDKLKSANEQLKTRPLELYRI